MTTLNGITHRHPEILSGVPAVSYTHLDVYKRQLLADREFVGEKWFNYLKNEGIDFIIPVSYTHLDVYKRQVLVKTLKYRCDRLCHDSR